MIESIRGNVDLKIMSITFHICQCFGVMIKPCKTWFGLFHWVSFTSYKYNLSKRPTMTDSTYGFPVKMATVKSECLDLHDSKLQCDSPHMKIRYINIHMT